MIPAAYSDIHKIDERVFDVNNGLCDFAEKGEWKGFVGILSQIVKENFAVRESVEGDKVVQSTIVALLTSAKGPYFVRHEGEAGGGFYDIALAPQLSRWPDIAHAALIEMKYVKAGDPVPSAEQLAKIKSDATEQLDRYSSDPALAVAWRLKESVKWKVESVELEGAPPALNAQRPARSSSVTLHRLALVFHGGDCVLAEEV